MTEKTFDTECGTIHYWCNNSMENRPTLVFLPGLTADHRLFEKQTVYFEDALNVLVWDAPGHAESRPFSFSFSLMDKAKWLNEILRLESIGFPIIVGQSMGGYVGQAYSYLFPDRLKGLICIDSAPLQRKYITGLEIWLLKKMEPVYRMYPWKSLLKSGSEGVATSEYGKKLMRKMMMTYDGDRNYYARLAGHGYRMLAEAYEADLPYDIKCPALLICGTEDRAGSSVRYNRAWSRNSGIEIEWIEGAGHNSNTDRPEQANKLIEDFVEKNHALCR